MRGKRNEPAYVAHTHAVLAGVLDMEEGALARLTTENFLTLFSKVSRPDGASRPDGISGVAGR
jgi:TatD DNase family protein